MTRHIRRLLTAAGAVPFLASTVFANAPMIGTPGAVSGPAPAAGGAPAGAPQQSPMGGSFLLIMMGVLVFMIVMTMMSGRKERKRREQMLSALGRYDRVQTIGGVIGTIVEMHDDEVTLKVDESTNTKIRFARSAVQSVLKKGSESRSESLEPAGASA